MNGGTPKGGEGGQDHVLVVIKIPSICVAITRVLTLAYSQAI